jgi:hypothetical protein
MIEVYLYNIKNVLESTPINYYKNKCKDIPAIVVSAGPSLSKNIHELKDIQKEFIIICGARTLKPLLDAGVVPDFVCIVDPGDVSFKFVEHCKNYHAKMVFCEVSNFKTVNYYEGDKIIFKEAMNFKDLSDCIFNYKIDELWHGGSVAHACMSFANYVGCSKIIFIGQDLAYTDNKRHDTKADFNNSNKLDIKEDENHLYVEDIYGKKVLTSKILNFYRKGFEEYIRTCSNIEFINATEGGANIKGTKIMTLKEAINNYRINKEKERIYENNFTGFDKNIVISNLMKIEKNLNKINKRTSKILNKIKDLDKKSIIINTKTINVLNNIKTNNKQIENVKILNSLINPILNRIISNPEYRDNSEDTDIEKIKKIIRQTKIFYKEVLNSIEYLGPLLKKLIKELKKGEENE